MTNKYSSMIIQREKLIHIFGTGKNLVVEMVNIISRRFNKIM